MDRLKDKVAIVTGGASGIGEATARLFVEEGAKVVITDIDQDAGQKAADEIGAGAEFMAQDVTSYDGWAALADGVEERHGTIDVLVNNAGTLKFCGLTDLTEADMRKIIDINLMGVMYGTQAVARVMLKHQAGSIVNVSSVDGLTAANALAPYCASKWGVRGFTKAAALELGHQGIRVNSIHPGGVFTPLANRMGQTKENFDNGFKIFAAQRSCYPVEIANGILYFASDEGAYCMGSELAIDGGMVAGHYYGALPGAPEALIPPQMKK